MIRIHKNLYVNRDQIGAVQLSTDETRIDVFRSDNINVKLCSLDEKLRDENKTVSAHFYGIVDQINQVDSGHGATN